MPIYKIDGSETFVKCMIIYVEADTEEEAENWAASINTWEDLSDDCIIHGEEMVDGDIDDVILVTQCDYGEPLKAQWKDGVVVRRPDVYLNPTW